MTDAWAGHESNDIANLRRVVLAQSRPDSMRTNVFRQMLFVVERRMSSRESTIAQQTSIHFIESQGRAIVWHGLPAAADSAVCNLFHVDAKTAEI